MIPVTAHGNSQFMNKETGIYESAQGDCNGYYDKLNIAELQKKKNKRSF